MIMAAHSEARQPASERTKAVDLAMASAVDAAAPSLRRRAWSPAEVAGQLGIKYKSALGLIRSGELGALKVGQHYIVPDVALERYLRSALPDQVAS
jgi:excisionase family DNA binding protein